MEDMIITHSSQFFGWKGWASNNLIRPTFHCIEDSKEKLVAMTFYCENALNFVLWSQNQSNSDDNVNSNTVNTTYNNNDNNNNNNNKDDDDEVWWGNPNLPKWSPQDHN